MMMQPVDIRQSENNFEAHQPTVMTQRQRGESECRLHRVYCCE